VAEKGPMLDQLSRFAALFGGLAMMVGLLLALRWTFGTGRNQPAPPVADPDDPTGFGLLEEVSVVPTEAAAEVLRSRLLAAGIRATVARAQGGGYRLLVFRDDLVPARVVLSRNALE
jgi:hypothetical protein